MDDVCKETFVGMMWRLATFCGVQIITYCVLSNHFHVLVRIPEAQNPTDQEMLDRMETLYGSRDPVVQAARSDLKRNGRIKKKLREAMLKRMGDVSEFMKELKQRFSRWYNRRHDRYGTLWAERFKSLIVEDQPSALQAVAAYIDLNPVRAGIVEDPKDYRWCGYAAALAGNERTRAGLMSFLPAKEWKEAAAEYRKRLFVGAGVAGRSGKTVLDREQIRKVLEQGGELSLGQILRLRIRHFTDGVALGSKAFVNEVFVVHRDKFGPKRKSGARPIRGVPLKELRVLRDLQVRAIT